MLPPANQPQLLLAIEGLAEIACQRKCLHGSGGKRIEALNQLLGQTSQAAAMVDQGAWRPGSQGQKFWSILRGCTGALEHLSHGLGVEPKETDQLTAGANCAEQPLGG